MLLPDPVGWFGKLPSLGDFASRRLAPEFIEAWDGWLSSGLSAWQASVPEGWLQAYLAGPSWRFIAMPGVLPGRCASLAWAGVLMPSVDRVGRYFPFTLAQPLAQLPAEPTQAGALLSWLHRLDDLAVDALHEDWSPDQLETALAREGAAPPEPVPDAIFSCPLPGLADPRLQTRLHGHVLWLADDASGRLSVRLHRGLPRGDGFAALLAGSPDDTPESQAFQLALADPHDF